jgi:hypothetical protein
MNLIAALEISTKDQILGIIVAEMNVERCPFDAEAGRLYKFKVVGFADRDDHQFIIERYAEWTTKEDSE